MNKLLTAAIGYAELGYKIFPVKPNDKSPLTQHGFKDATTDVNILEAWWLRWPKANVGLYTGGLLVVDIDGPTHPWLKDNKQMELLATCTVMSITPRGGRHYFYQQPAGKRWSSKIIFKNVDTRTDSGYVLVYPSVIDGKRYRWGEGFKLHEGRDALSVTPDWLVELMDSPSKGTPNDLYDEVGLLRQIPTGERNNKMYKLAARLRDMGLSESMILGSLTAVNKEICNPNLSRYELKKIAESAAKNVPDEVRMRLAGMFDDGVDISKLLESLEIVRKVHQIPDPGLLSDSLLSVPGFIDRVMMYSLTTAKHPNRKLSFAGALSLMSFLIARKVTDTEDTRSNLYILSLAQSGSGKEHARQVNRAILTQAGASECIGDGFASAEGIEDALLINPAMLFQTDEIDGLIHAISHTNDARFDAIMGKLLSLFTCSNSSMTMRVKAGKEKPAIIDQPSLTLLGTAVPNNYYDALSSRMMYNGFFARMLVFDKVERGDRQYNNTASVPADIISEARYWIDAVGGTGNLSSEFPDLRVIKYTVESLDALKAVSNESQREYKKAEGLNDSVGTAVWARTPEKVQKLALIYTLSQDRQAVEIPVEAVEWAGAVVNHLTRSMLYLAEENVSDGLYDKKVKLVLRTIKQNTGGKMDRCDLLKVVGCRASELTEITQTLIERGDISKYEKKTGGRSRNGYKFTR